MWSIFTYDAYVQLQFYALFYVRQATASLRSCLYICSISMRNTSSINIIVYIPTSISKLPLRICTSSSSSKYSYYRIHTYIHSIQLNLKYSSDLLEINLLKIKYVPLFLCCIRRLQTKLTIKNVVDKLCQQTIQKSQ